MGLVSDILDDLQIMVVDLAFGVRPLSLAITLSHSETETETGTVQTSDTNS